MAPDRKRSRMLVLGVAGAPACAGTSHRTKCEVNARIPAVSVPDSPLRAVVFDLDGVIRHWNDDELDAIEAACGLPPRTILDTGFAEDLGPACMTGRLTYRQ